jgi:predicted PurR-regulated permease PerM
MNPEEKIEDLPDDATQEALDEVHAEAAVEAQVSDENEYGRLGRRFDRSHPFYVGLTGAFGVICAFALAWMVVAAGQVLVLLGLAFFLALGLEPAVVWLYRRGFPRWLAVAAVLTTGLGIFAGFLLLAIPILVSQGSHLADALPGYLHSAKNQHTELGKLDARYHVIGSVQKLLHGKVAFGTALGIGEAVLNFAVSALIVIVVTIYLLIDLPRVRQALYQLAPKSRRPRAVLLTDEIFGRVGGYVLGTLLTSAIAGGATWLWALAFGIPYALLLGLLVAILDLIPIVGSTIGGIIVSLIAMTVSIKLAVATAVFYVVFRLLEDYLLTPRIMTRTVAVPGLVTVVAVTVGGAMLGIVGAFVAIPLAAGIKLIVDEVAAPRLDVS